MQNVLKSDLLRTALLSFSLLVFPLFVRQFPPPQAIQSIASWQFAPLNAALADRFYTQALASFQAGNQDLGKSWLVSAIAVDSQAFSPRYTEFIEQRTQWLAQ